MQLQAIECVADRQFEALGHVTAASIWRARIVAEVCRLEYAQHNLGDVDDADDCARIPEADQKANVLLALQPLNVSPPGPLIQRRR
jgi:hypothetical protein